MEEAIRTKEKIKNFFEKKYTWTIIYSIIIILYLASINVTYRLINPEVILGNTDNFSIITLLISILMLEISYNKKGKNILSSVELLIVSVYILIMNHMSKVYNYNIGTYLMIGMFIAILYYILKMGIICTKEHKQKLSNMSDIKQIIKEEPIKRETKRKNIKK